MKNYSLRLVATVLIAASCVFIGSPATAADNECVPQDAWTETVVDVEAWTETINHPAVTHVVSHPPVTHEETVIDSLAIWANWSPNDTKGPQDYVPIWPTDARGTWHIHNQLPPGHEGPDGVYQQGQGNSPWFYRQAEVSHVITVIDVEAWEETVVDVAAWVETIDHPAETHEVYHEAVTCDDEPVDLCPNIEGDQEVLPEGLIVDSEGNCVEPVEEPEPCVYDDSLAADDPLCVPPTEPTCETDPSLCPVEPCPDDSLDPETCEPPVVVDVCPDIPGVQTGTPEICEPPVVVPETPETPETPVTEPEPKPKPSVKAKTSTPTALPHTGGPWLADTGASDSNNRWAFILGALLVVSGVGALKFGSRKGR